MSVIEGGRVGRASVPGADESDVSAPEMPCSDGSFGGPSAERSPIAAPIPRWTPLTKAGPRAAVSLSGGRNPNGVVTLAGPVDQVRERVPDVGDKPHRIQQRQLLGGDHVVGGGSGSLRRQHNRRIDLRRR